MKQLYRKIFWWIVRKHAALVSVPVIVTAEMAATALSLRDLEDGLKRDAEKKMINALWANKFLEWQKTIDVEGNTVFKLRLRCI